MTTLKEMMNLNQNQNNPSRNLKLLSQSLLRLSQSEKCTKLEKIHMSLIKVNLWQNQLNQNTPSQYTTILKDMQTPLSKNVTVLNALLTSILQSKEFCSSLEMSMEPYYRKSRTLLAQETISFRKSLIFWWPSLKNSVLWATTSSMNTSENSKRKVLRSRPRVMKPSLMRSLHHLTISVKSSSHDSKLKLLTTTKRHRLIKPGTSLSIKSNF